MQSHTGRAAPSHRDRDGALGHVCAQGPVRTCVGCRGTGVRSELVRLVGRRAEPVTAGGPHGPVVVVVDERRSMPGRGAWIHADARCLELAEKRRAPARALRLDGPADLSQVRGWMSKRTADRAATCC